MQSFSFFNIFFFLKTFHFFFCKFFAKLFISYFWILIERNYFSGEILRKLLTLLLYCDIFFVLLYISHRNFIKLFYFPHTKKENFSFNFFSFLFLYFFYYILKYFPRTIISTTNKNYDTSRRFSFTVIFLLLFWNIFQAKKYNFPFENTNFRFNDKNWFYLLWFILF